MRLSVSIKTLHSECVEYFGIGRLLLKESHRICGSPFTALIKATTTGSAWFAGSDQARHGCIRPGGHSVGGEDHAFSPFLFQIRQSKCSDG